MTEEDLEVVEQLSYLVLMGWVLLLFSALKLLQIDKETLGYDEYKFKEAIDNLVEGNGKKSAVNRELCSLEAKVKALNCDKKTKDTIVEIIETIKDNLSLFKE